MSKREDLKSLAERIGPFPLCVAEPAWELGRIAGIRGAARDAARKRPIICIHGHDAEMQLAIIDDLRAKASKLKRRLK